MSFSRDQAARFARLAAGRHTALAVTAAPQAHVLSPRAVAFNVQNNGEEIAIRLRSDGTPTASSGWRLAAGEQTGWIDVVGGASISLIAEAATTQNAQVWEVLDEDGA